MVSPLLGRFLVSFNLQSAICGLQSAVCGPQSAVCSLQSANVIHQSASVLNSGAHSFRFLGSQKLPCYHKQMISQLDPYVYISQAGPEGQYKSSLRLTKWHEIETFHLMYVKHPCITLGFEIA